MKQITVKRGDTLWGLAHEHLGHGALWPETRPANPSVA